MIFIDSLFECLLYLFRVVGLGFNLVHLSLMWLGCLFCGYLGVVLRT